MPCWLFMSRYWPIRRLPSWSKSLDCAQKAGCAWCCAWCCATRVSKTPVPPQTPLRSQPHVQNSTSNATDLCNRMCLSFAGTLRALNVHLWEHRQINLLEICSRFQIRKLTEIAQPITTVITSQTRNAQQIPPLRRGISQSLPIALTRITSSSLFLCMSCFSSSTIFAIASFSVSWSFSDNYCTTEKWIR